MAEQIPFFIKHSWVILLLPLLAFAVNGLWLCRKSHKASGWLSTGLAGLAMVWAGLAAEEYIRVVLASPQIFPDRSLIAWSWQWLHMHEGLTVHIAGLIDPISVMMLVVITVIAFLVNIYSMGYMADDPSMGRFFALLSLFAFSMLGLVLSSNILQMFIFWELVGTSSYTLIGFWYHKPAAVSASKKAFIVTRFADAFFLLGIVITAFHTGTFDIASLNSPEAAQALNKTVSLGLFSINALSLCTLLIFMGGWGKSAMFPLHIWLPDAMEGPTPVSSIIHSATMVVAGVYLTARMFPLFAAAEHTLAIIKYVGAFTALFAAVIACTQKDIKRILAFSTLSQLGYMMFSLGVSASHSHGINPLGYSASMFHVFNHAFFKCMLFLGAGSIIHAVHSNYLDQMGGLKKHMPYTFWALLIACLAIAGIPPFSGFFSKDEIILAAFQSGHYDVFALGLIVGGLTAFYMFRFFFMVFMGAPRQEYHHIHEDKFMTFSIVALTLPTAFAGILAGSFSKYVLPQMTFPEFHGAHPMWLPILATTAGVTGIFLAWLLYGRKQSNIALALAESGRPAWYKTIVNKFYIDELYLFITHKIIFEKFAAPAKWIDRKVVDGFFDLFSNLLHFASILIRTLQSGRLSFYLSVTVFGLLLIWYLGNLPL
jgi:NADH-quinone oxidoreductase subunit L